MASAPACCQVSLGLRDAGYSYINVDDGWLEQTRSAATGQLQPSLHGFPGGEDGMRNLSRYIHDKGLRFGVYSSNSMTTCMKLAGGLYNERLDAARPDHMHAKPLTLLNSPLGLCGAHSFKTPQVNCSPPGSR